MAKIKFTLECTNDDPNCECRNINIYKEFTDNVKWPEIMIEVARSLNDIGYYIDIEKLEEEGFYIP